MAIHKIRKDDQVIVLKGKDRGRQGRVTKVRDDRLIVEGINVSKKHVKPNPQRGVQGGIIEKEMSIHISNVALVNPTTNRADKVGIKYLADNKKVRYFKSNGEVVS